MQFSNSFEVPLPPDEAWTTLMDIPRIAPCMPGAELTEVVDDDTYKGKVSVRLGPMGLAFAGTARFEKRDEATKSATVKAQGMDAKGRGRAAASVDFHLAPSDRGTRVLITTDLNLTGAVAQYGRGAGVIQSIAGQIIDQFAACLEAKVLDERRAAGGVVASEEPGGSSEAARPPAPPRAAPQPQAIGGFGLLFKALWASVKGMFSSRRGG